MLSLPSGNVFAKLLRVGWFQNEYSTCCTQTGQFNVAMLLHVQVHIQCCTKTGTCEF